MSEPETPESAPPMVPPVTRRGFLFKLGLGLNAVAAGLLTVPIIGFKLFAIGRYVLHVRQG